MKKRFSFITVFVLSLAFLMISISAQADDGKIIDWSQYDLEELLQIQNELSVEINQRKIEYSEKNGDRIIRLSDSSITLFTGNTYETEVTVDRLLDEAPENTRLIWTSSDDSVAAVDSNGVVSGKSRGVATIECHAEDDEFIRSSIEVNVVLPVTKVTIPANVGLIMNESDTEPVTKRLECGIEPTDAYDMTIVWASDNEEVVTVNEEGVLTAIGPGKARITATSSDGYFDRPITAVCDVTVSLLGASSETEFDEGIVLNWDSYGLDDLIQIQEKLAEEIYQRKIKYAQENGDRTIQLSDSSITLFAGKTYEPEVTIERVLDEAPEQTKLVWTSSDESVATVDSRGQVSGKSRGTATILCCAEDNEFIRNTIFVNVVLPVTKVTIPTEVEMAISESDVKPVTMQLVCGFEPEEAYDKTVEWTSDNEEVVTVDAGGMLTAVGPGSAKVTVSSSDGYSDHPITAECKVTVRLQVSSIEPESDSLVIDKNKTQRISYVILPENASQQTVEWVSSDPDIVMVNSRGEVTAKACGTATVTCSSTDGSDVSASIEITVVQRVTELRWEDNTAIVLNVSDSIKPEVRVLPEDATDKTLTWESSDPSVLLVTGDGKITAVRSGTAKITCTAADGSEKSITREVFVPSICIKKTEYTITSKNDFNIDFEYYGTYDDFNWSVSSDYYCDSKCWVGGKSSYLVLSPKKAGSFTITLSDAKSSRSRQTIKITVEHSAAYDTVSYPTADYTEILRYPSSNNGKQCSIYGKVLQKQTSGGTTVLRVGTGGYGYYDKVFYITYSNSKISVNVIEDDYITIYGKCTGAKTYTTVLGGSVTIPSIEAEKIMMGRN